MYGAVVAVVVVVVGVMLIMMVKVVLVPTPNSHPSLLLHMLGEKHRFPSSIFQNVQWGHFWSGQAIAF